MMFITTNDRIGPRLLAEEPKNDADDDEHQRHADEDANHRRIGISDAGRFFHLG